MKNIKEIIIGVLILAFLGIMCIRQTDNPNLDFRIIDSKINTNYLLDNKDKMIVIKCIINDGDTTIIKKFGDKQMDFSSKHIKILRSAGGFSQGPDSAEKIFLAEIGPRS